MKLSVSLSDEDIAILDAYVERTRSAVPAGRFAARGADAALPRPRGALRRSVVGVVDGPACRGPGSRDRDRLSDAAR
jgi:hypothetical protein